MADLFADALMLAIKIVVVTGYLFLFVYTEIHDKARERKNRKNKEVDSDDV